MDDSFECIDLLCFLVRSLGPGWGGYYIVALHPIRDGASSLLLIETPPTFGRSLRCFHILRDLFCFTILSPSYLAACGHHLSLRIAIVFFATIYMQSTKLLHVTFFQFPNLLL